MSELKCPECGSDIFEGLKFCTNCGAPVQGQVTDAPEVDSEVEPTEGPPEPPPPPEGAEPETEVTAEQAEAEEKQEQELSQAGPETRQPETGAAPFQPTRPMKVPPDAARQPAQPMPVPPYAPPAPPYPPVYPAAPVQPMQTMQLPPQQTMVQQPYAQPYAGAPYAAPARRGSPAACLTTGIISLLSGAAVIAATFLPWIGSGGLGYSGWEMVTTTSAATSSNVFLSWGNGIIFFSGFWSLLIGTFVMLGGLILLFRKKAGGVLALLFGLVGTAIAGVNIAMVYSKMRVGAISAGVGLFLFVGFSVLALIMGIVGYMVSD